MITTTDTETFMALMKTLIEAGWKIIEYKDHGEGVSLTIVHEERKKDE